MFFKTDVLKKFVIFAGKHLCWTLVLMKLQLYQKEYWWLICREKSFILKKWEFPVLDCFYHEKSISAEKQNPVSLIFVSKSNSPRVRRLLQGTDSILNHCDFDLKS